MIVTPDHPSIVSSFDIANQYAILRLHTGIVINDREYAFGAVPHPTEPSRTGVFWTRPRLEPPGGTFRCSILHGFTYLTGNDLDKLLRDISSEFPGKDYNLLSNNCNHFTNRVCKALTHREAPAWINRASKVGVLMPCIIPKEMLSPPDGDSLDGWNDEEEDELEDDTYGMLESARRSGNAAKVRDSDGRVIPASERAPRDRLLG